MSAHNVYRLRNLPLLKKLGLSSALLIGFVLFLSGWAI